MINFYSVRRFLVKAFAVSSDKIHPIRLTLLFIPCQGESCVRLKTLLVCCTFITAQVLCTTFDFYCLSAAFFFSLVWICPSCTIAAFLSRGQHLRGTYFLMARLLTFRTCRHFRWRILRYILRSFPDAHSPFLIISRNSLSGDRSNLLLLPGCSSDLVSNAGTNTLVIL